MTITAVILDNPPHSGNLESEEDEKINILVFSPNIAW